METQLVDSRVCRLCLENEKDGGFLVEIFSKLINEAGKVNITEKIKILFGLKVSQFQLFNKIKLSRIITLFWLSF
jgi:hypothetical protein